MNTAMTKAIVDVMDACYDGRCQRVDLEAEGFTGEDVVNALAQGKIYRERPPYSTGGGIWSWDYLLTKAPKGARLHALKRKVLFAIKTIEYRFKVCAGRSV